MPDWVLSIAYWLHMAATVVWIGGLFYYSAVLIPALTSTDLLHKEPGLLEALQKRFNPMAWLSLALLVLTGLLQMTGSPQYEGVLVVDDRWSVVIFIKHIAILLMVILASYQTWILQPQISRLVFLHSLKESAGDDSAGRNFKRSLRLTRWNLALGLLVLALTAVARTA